MDVEHIRGKFCPSLGHIFQIMPFFAFTFLSSALVWTYTVLPKGSETQIINENINDPIDEWVGMFRSFTQENVQIQQYKVSK